LTTERLAFARSFAQERAENILTMAPVDEALFEDYLRRAYQVAGLHKPMLSGDLTHQ
jgi:hypothetical protein